MSGGDAADLQPWQLFTLAGLIGATIVVFFSKGQSPAAVGIAALRTFGPLLGLTSVNAPQIFGGRTRVALEREKALVLRTIKELEFDRAMGKVSEKDFTDMSARLRARAARLIRQLDAGAGYRDQIEKEMEKRVGAARATTTPVKGLCRSCGTQNDQDARFCKRCGHVLGAQA